MFQLVQQQDLLILAMILMITSLLVVAQVQHIHLVVISSQSVLTPVHHHVVLQSVITIFILDKIQVVRCNPVTTTLQSVVVQEEI